MAKYRHRAVATIEAVQVTGPPWPVGDVPQWLTDAVMSGTVSFQGGEYPYVIVRNTTGKGKAEERASVGDYIVRSPKDGLYVQRRDHFEGLWEPAQ